MNKNMMLSKLLNASITTLGLIAVIGFIGAARVENNKKQIAAKPDESQTIKAPVVPVNYARPVINIATARQDQVELLQTAPVATPAPVTRSYRTIRMEVTAYCPCKKCCGPNAQGLTASGQHVSFNNGKFVAADTDKLPFNTQLIIPGYGEQSVQVLDRGSAIKGNRLDVFFPTHQEALNWGRQKLDVKVME